MVLYLDKVQGGPFFGIRYKLVLYLDKVQGDPFGSIRYKVVLLAR